MHAAEALHGDLGDIRKVSASSHTRISSGRQC
jgi:hypothetical protein